MNYENLRLEDVGTRYQHYTELMELWEDGLRILRNISEIHKSVLETKQEQELEIAGRFLRKQIEVMSDYMPYQVRDQIDSAHKEEK